MVAKHMIRLYTDVALLLESSHGCKGGEFLNGTKFTLTALQTITLRSSHLIGCLFMTRQDPTSFVEHHCSTPLRGDSTGSVLPYVDAQWDTCSRLTVKHIATDTHQYKPTRQHTSRPLEPVFADVVTRAVTAGHEAGLTINDEFAPSSGTSRGTPRWQQRRTS